MSNEIKINQCKRAVSLIDSTQLYLNKTMKTLQVVAPQAVIDISEMSVNLLDIAEGLEKMIKKLQVENV